MINENTMIWEGTLSERSPRYYVYRFYYYDMFGQKKRKPFSGTDANELYMKADEFLAKQEMKNRGIDLDSIQGCVWERSMRLDRAI